MSPQAPVTPPAAAPAKPRVYRCPNGSYTIPIAMCVGRQQNHYAQCPKCGDRAPLPESAAPASSTPIAPSNPN